MDDLALDPERRRVGGAFFALAALAPVLALLPPDGASTPRAVGAYLAITAVVAGVTWRRWDQLEVVVGPTSVAYIAAVVILRHAEGAGTSGLVPLLLLPLFWCSLVGTRWSLGMVLAGTALALVGPIVALGDPLYPVTEWRRAVVWLTVAPLVGGATLRLRRRADAAGAEVAALARTDALTGCLNRRGLAEVATRELARAERGGTAITLALLDLDHFKRFNDTRGHDEGDQLLQTATVQWQQALRPTDVLARWGGEEFVVLLPETAPQSAIAILDRLRARTPEGQTCSIGVAPVQVGAADGVALAVSRADEALYRAKQEGRDRVVTAD